MKPLFPLTEIETDGDSRARNCEISHCPWWTDDLTKTIMRKEAVSLIWAKRNGRTVDSNISQILQMVFEFAVSKNSFQLCFPNKKICNPHYDLQNVSDLKKFMYTNLFYQAPTQGESMNCLSYFHYLTPVFYEKALTLKRLI